MEGMKMLGKRLESTFRHIQEKMPQIVSVTESGAVSEAVRLLHEGHVIAVPTDTIYGIAALVQNTTAIQQLYKIKGRELNNPIAISVGDIQCIQSWGNTTHLPPQLLQSLLPGAVTVVLTRQEALNPDLNPTSNLVGIRIPNNSFIRQVSQLCESPLALTSANISTQPSCLAVHEFQAIWPSLHAIFDNGTLSYREGSTVVDISKPKYFEIYRKGSAYKSTVEILEKFGFTLIQ